METPEQGNAATPMPSYTSHKKVWALKIASVEHVRCDTTTDENEIVRVFFVDRVFSPRDVNLRGKPTPSAGWYMVQYEDGYISFSPEKQFEEGHLPNAPKSLAPVASYDFQIEQWFTYHPPSEDQQKRYVELRAAAKHMAYAIKANTKACADQSAAFRLLRECVMTANASIAMEGAGTRPTIAELEAILQSDDDKPITINPDGSITVDEA